MTPDGRQLLDDGVTVYEGPTAEGTKFHKIGDYYYLSIPEGGVGPGWQTVLRSKDIYGPYERKVVLETGSTAINGPHQGAIVDTPYGEWWFLHFQKKDPLGRVVHLQPMQWVDGWPVMGEDYDGNGVGEPVPGWTKPKAGRKTKPSLPASSDDFSKPVLGLQWQFNHNPVDSAWSLVRKAGSLALDALPAPCFKMARNTVSQKIMGYQGACTAVLDCSSMAEGQFAGLSCMGQDNHCTGVIVRNGVKVLVAGHESGVQEAEGTVLEGDRVWLRLEYDTEANSFSFSFSLDGKTFAAAGDPFEMHFGFWKGARVALFSYNCTSAQPSGTAFFDSFDYRLDR